MRFLANLFAGLGHNAAHLGTTACLMWMFDEPKMSKSLIEK